jgi:hypothetical protein
VSDPSPSPAARTPGLLRRQYGASPLHLLTLMASFAVSGAAIDGWLHLPTSQVVTIIIWFLAVAIGHDLVLLPLYSLVDRIAFGAGRRRVASPAVGSPPGSAYVRVPLLLSAILLIAFFPEILRLGNASFESASGHSQDPYLARWLLASGILLALSAFAYALSLARHRRRAA